MSDREQAIIQTVQRIMAEHDVKLSENDAILFLIESASTPDPLTAADARAAIERHWDTCPVGCSPTPPPKCAMGVHLMRAYLRVEGAERERYAGPSRPPAPPAPVLSAASVAAASVAAATRGGTP